MIFAPPNFKLLPTPLMVMPHAAALTATNNDEHSNRLRT